MIMTKAVFKFNIMEDISILDKLLSLELSEEAKDLALSAKNDLEALFYLEDILEDMEERDKGN